MYIIGGVLIALILAPVMGMVYYRIARSLFKFFGRPQAPDRQNKIARWIAVGLGIISFVTVLFFAAEFLDDTPPSRLPPRIR